MKPDKRKKLTDEQVAEIRRVYRPGTPGRGKKSDCSACGLAKRYGIEVSTVRGIVRGTSWKQ